MGLAVACGTLMSSQWAVAAGGGAMAGEGGAIATGGGAMAAGGGAMAGKGGAVAAGGGAVDAAGGAMDAALGLPCSLVQSCFCTQCLSTYRMQPWAGCGCQEPKC